MRLIDADKLKQKIAEMQQVYNEPYELYDNGFQDAVGQIDDTLDNLLTIDTVKHGEWISCRKPSLWDLIVFKCSICGCENYDDSLYCPFCGAKMEGDKLCE